MGNVGEQFITKTTAVCSCLPQAFSIVTQGLYETVTNGADFSGAVSGMIAEVMKLQTVSENHFLDDFRANGMISV